MASSLANRVASRHLAKYRSKKELDDGTTVYEYGPRQVKRRHEEKASRVQKLRELRSRLVKRVKRDFKAKDMRTRLTALAVALIDHTYERVGNDESAKEGHFGVTGWLKKHISFANGQATIKYVGKSGVRQTKTVKDKAAIALLKEVTKGKKPNDPIFTQGDVTVTSKDVNEYLPEGITAKDLRGLHANEEMRARLKAIRSQGEELPRLRKDRDKILKRELDKALKETAKIVGHEPSTLRSQYLVPALVDSYLKDGTVIEKLTEKTATKSRAEREEEQERKLLRPDPKLKPPRHDLRKHRVEEDDEDTERANQENDRDLSRNYKKIAYLWMLAADKAKSEEGAKKLFDRYREKSPDTDKTWKDFYDPKGGDDKAEDDSKGSDKGDKAEDDSKGSGKAKPGDKSDKDDPEADERAKAVAHRKLVKDTLSAVTDKLKGQLKGDAKMPPSVRAGISTALEGMSPEEVEAFGSAFTDFVSQARDMPQDGSDAVKKAERILEDLEDDDFASVLDPERLAEMAVGMAYAESVINADRKRKKGLERQIADTVSNIEAEVGKLLGNDKYVIPSDIKNLLKEQMADMDAKDFDEFAESIAKTMKTLDAEGEQDSDDALEQARETLEEFQENVEDYDNAFAKADEIAAAMRAQRIVDRHGERKKRKSKATKRLIQDVGKIFGDEVPPELAGKITAYTERMDEDDLADFFNAVQAENERIQSSLQTDPETGMVSVPDDVMDQMVAAMDPNLDALHGEGAKQVARAMAAQTTLADPTRVGGQPLSTKPQTNDQLRNRGLQAMEQYSRLPAPMREAAAEKLAQKLKDVPPDSPEAREMNRILDGITLAAILDPTLEEGKVPQIPGRELNAGFVDLARAMAADGKAALLLGPVEDFQGPEGQAAVASAMDSMSDDALARSVKSIMPDAAEVLSELPEAKRQLLRRTLIDVAVDNMSVIDRALKSRLESTGDDSFDDAEYRAEKLKEAQSIFTRSYWEKMLAKWLKDRGDEAPLSSGIPSGEPGAGAKLAQQNLKVEDPSVGIRQEFMRDMLKRLDEVAKGDGKSHSERAMALFTETGDPRYLRSRPEQQKQGSQIGVWGNFPRFSLDNWTTYMAGQPPFAATSVSTHFPRGRLMTKLSKEAALNLTANLDAVASAVQNHAEALGIPNHIAKDFAYRCDLISDEIDKTQGLRREATTGGAPGPGQHALPTKDENMNMGPPQRFNPAEIGAPDAKPPKVEPDEPYMDNNFLQEEFSELRRYQEDGLFSNAKAASAILDRMAAKVAGMKAALPSE